jgi:hypothetical protein
MVHSASYSAWAALDTLLGTSPFPGTLEKRGGGLIDPDRERLKARMRAYLDPAITFEQARTFNPELGTNRAGYDAKRARTGMVAAGFIAKNLKRYAYFAFDMRYAYTTEQSTVWNRVRPQLLHLLPDAGGFLLVRPQRIADPEGFPAYWTTCLADDHAIHKDAFLVPVVDNLSGAARPNLSRTAIGYLQTLGIEPSREAAALLLYHVLATLYCPLYLTQLPDFGALVNVKAAEILDLGAQ